MNTTKNTFFLIKKYFSFYYFYIKFTLYIFNAIIYVMRTMASNNIPIVNSKNTNYYSLYLYLYFLLRGSSNTIGV